MLITSLILSLCFDVWIKSGVLGLDVGVVGAVAEKSGSQQKRSSRGGLWSGL
jgi:hypothetical protein